MFVLASDILVGDYPARLIQHEIVKCLWHFEALTVNANIIACSVRAHAKGRLLAVYGHATSLDELFCRTPRGKTSARQYLL
jgi:hypothetical protein